MNVKKVGHAGTLDPFAGGVLLVCTGKATKRVSELVELTKEYRGTIKLGAQTDTDDVTGAVIATGDPSHITLSDVQKVCKRFEGTIPQIPPMYSAKKISGQRLYKIARRGQVVERKPSMVTIHSLEVYNFKPPFFSIKVICKKGTYIRALARDIGEELGCKAHLHSLIRTRVGDYHINDAMTLDDFKNIMKDESIKTV